jgi:hypothetical protein
VSAAASLPFSSRFGALRVCIAALLSWVTYGGTLGLYGQSLFGNERRGGSELTAASLSATPNERSLRAFDFGQARLST